MDPRRLLPALVAVCVVAVAVTLGVRVGLPWWHERDAAATTPPDGELSQARAVLADWDDRRAAAWATGDTGSLAALYVDDAPAGRADVSALRAYRERGFVVEDMASQVIAFRAVQETPDRLVVVVVDRVVGARAVAGGRSTPLPSARPVQRRITLVRRDGEWVVANVRRTDGAR